MILNPKNYLICLFIAMLLVLLRVADPFFIETARLKSFDYYQRNQQQVQSENIALVEIDENSLDQHGQWPWPRDIIADGVKKAYDAGASLVVLPILFAENDRMGFDDYLINTIQQLPIILGQSASLKGKGEPVPRGLSVVGPDISDFIFEYKQAIGPVKELGDNAAGVGMLATAPELDGVVRRMPLIIQVKGKYYPTLSLEVLRLLGQQESYQVKSDEVGIQAIRVKGLDPIKTDANSRIWLNYKYNFTTISFTNPDWSSLKDKVVIISPAAEGLTNTVPTALGIRYSQYIHATTLQMMIDNGRLVREDKFTLYEILTAAGICSFIIIGALWLPYWASLAAILISVCSLPYIGGELFKMNMLYDYSWPVFAIFVTWSAATFIRFVQENKTKQLIKKQFEHYLAPSVVKLLQKNPGKLKLGGDTRELTILFSDLRDFTTISEKFKANPQDLTNLINKYLTPMTGCVIDHHGTVDKFIGDALMAFWNAPVDLEDHREKSIECARQMFVLLEQLNKELEASDMVLKIGIGLNTGPVVVGNMGSDQRFDYTCLGDAVNLSARLEGQTKPYKVGILLGQETVKGIEDKFNFYELDKIAVKGKTEGISIFTVLYNSTGREQHAKFIQAYREQKWELAKEIATINKVDIPELAEYYKMMIERIAELEVNLKDENWDTIYRLTTK